MKGRAFSDLSNKVIGCVIEVHKTLGPGLLESTYQQCLAHEFGINQIRLHRSHAGASLPLS
ncbi:MAG: GxxExxY protein [Methylobacter sp.]|nr:GxxExxY protein [Methylobacter sp.]